MSGLLVYLAGPGRANEHSEPHLVAGDPALMAWHDDNELGREAALAIARHLDRPKTAFGVDVPGGHVWHCSLSLSAEEGQLADQRWQEIAEQFVSRMGFDDAAGSKAPTRWVGFRHGVSKNGNDHIHVVVNLVREDGTKASIHNDRPRAQAVCRALEVEHGLLELDSTSRGRASRGFAPAEREADARRRARGGFEGARRRGQEARLWPALPGAERHELVAAQRGADQPRWALARQVRASATAAADEAEFVRRLRRGGVLVRARFAEGTSDVITGYSVASKPAVGERPIWYGGGSLARDLTLPRLRQEWPDTPQAATEAAAEWEAARRHRRPVSPGREVGEPDPQLWQEVGADLEQLREQLRVVPVSDREAWARVARQTSGAFAAWSVRVEPTPGPLAATADALARSAELRRMPARPQKAGLVSAAGAALLLASVARGGHGAAAQAIMLRQLANLGKALFDMHRADQDARRAAQIEHAVRGELATISARLGEAGSGHLPAAPAADVGTGDAAVQEDAITPPQTRPGSPVPNELGERPRTRAGRTGTDGRPDERRRAGQEGR